MQLNGGQHLQIGSVLAQRGLTVNDGRVEVRVTSPGGKVTQSTAILPRRFGLRISRETPLQG